MEISDEMLIEYLRTVAKNDAEEGEYKPAEHCAYAAADRLEALRDISHTYLRMLIEVAHGYTDLNTVREFLVLTNPKGYQATLLKIVKHEYPNLSTDLEAFFGPDGRVKDRILDNPTDEGKEVFDAVFRAKLNEGKPLPTEDDLPNSHTRPYPMFNGRGGGDD